MKRFYPFLVIIALLILSNTAHAITATCTLSPANSMVVDPDSESSPFSMIISEGTANDTAVFDTTSTTPTSHTIQITAPQGFQFTDKNSLNIAQTGTDLSNTATTAFSINDKYLTISFNTNNISSVDAFTLTGVKIKPYFGTDHELGNNNTIKVTLDPTGTNSSTTASNGNFFTYQYSLSGDASSFSVKIKESGKADFPASAKTITLTAPKGFVFNDAGAASGTGSDVSSLSLSPTNPNTRQVTLTFTPTGISNTNEITISSLELVANNSNTTSTNLNQVKVEYNSTNKLLGSFKHIFFSTNAANPLATNQGVPSAAFSITIDESGETDFTAGNNNVTLTAPKGHNFCAGTIDVNTIPNTNYLNIDKPSFVIPITASNSSEEKITITGLKLKPINLSTNTSASANQIGVNYSSTNAYLGNFQSYIVEIFNNSGGSYSTQSGITPTNGSHEFQIQLTEFGNKDFNTSGCTIKLVAPKGLLFNGSGNSSNFSGTDLSNGTINSPSGGGSNEITCTFTPSNTISHDFIKITGLSLIADINSTAGDNNLKVQFNNTEKTVGSFSTIHYSEISQANIGINGSTPSAPFSVTITESGMNNFKRSQSTITLTAPQGLEFVNTANTGTSLTSTSDVSAVTIQNFAAGDTSSTISFTLSFATEGTQADKITINNLVLQQGTNSAGTPNKIRVNYNNTNQNVGNISASNITSEITGAHYNNSLNQHIIPFGKESDPFTIRVSEANVDDLTKSITGGSLASRANYKITITPPMGMAFVDTGITVFDATNSDIIGKIKPSIDSFKLEYTFIIDEPDYVDVIDITNLKLTQDNSNTTGTAKIGIKLEEVTSSTTVSTINFPSHAGDFAINTPTAMSISANVGKFYCANTDSVEFNATFSVPDTNVINHYPLGLYFNYGPSGYIADTIHVLASNKISFSSVAPAETSTNKENVYFVLDTLGTTIDKYYERIEITTNPDYNPYSTQYYYKHIKILNIPLTYSFTDNEYDANFRDGYINLWSLLNTKDTDITKTTRNNPPQNHFALDPTRQELYYYPSKEVEGTFGGVFRTTDTEGTPYRFELEDSSSHGELSDTNNYKSTTGTPPYITHQSQNYWPKNYLMDFALMSNSIKFEESNKVIYKELHHFNYYNTNKYCIVKDSTFIKVLPEDINIKSTICASDSSDYTFQVRSEYINPIYGTTPIDLKKVIIEIGNDTAHAKVGSTYRYSVQKLTNQPWLYTFNPSKYYETGASGSPYLYVYFTAIGNLNNDPNKSEIILSQKVIKIVSTVVDNGLVDIEGRTLCPTTKALPLISDFNIIEITNGEGVNFDTYTNSWYLNPQNVYANKNNSGNIWEALADSTIIQIPNSIKNDSIVYKYSDNNRCEGTHKTFYTLNPLYADVSGANIADFSGNFCPSADSITMISNTNIIDSVIGDGISSSVQYGLEIFNFTPADIFAHDSISVYKDTMIRNTLVINYYDSVGCPWIDTMNIQVGTTYENEELINIDTTYRIYNASASDTSDVSKSQLASTDSVFQLIGTHSPDSFIVHYIDSSANDTLGALMGVQILDTIHTYKYETKIYEITKTDGDFTNLNDNYCAIPNEFELKSSMQIDSVTAKAISDTSGGDFRYNPFFPFTNSTNSITDTIGYTHILDTVTLYYRDANNCPYTTTRFVNINALPELDSLTVSNLCINDTSMFHQYISVDSSNLNILTWNFGDDNFLIQDTATHSLDSNVKAGTHDNRTIGTYRTPGHRYLKPGTYYISILATSDHGCKNTFNDSVIIGAYPELSFTTSSYNNTDSVIFNNNTKLSLYDDPINNYSWNLDDASHSNMGIYNAKDTNFVLEHKFAQVGVHNITLAAITDNGCETIDTFHIPSFPVITVTENMFFSTKFKQGEDTTGWIPVKLYKPEYNSTWEYDTINDIFIDDKHPAGSNMWITGHTDTINEKGWLETPTFDFSTLPFPALSIDVFQSLEPGRDGAVLQYSHNDGNTWNTLGEEGAGSNWYNHQGIATNPGIINSGDYNRLSEGWSTDSSSWVTARYALDGIPQEQRDSIRFRIAYSSNDYRDSLKYRGFAITNFAIGQRKRVTLIEEFINSEYENHSDHKGFTTHTDTTALNEFVDGHAVEVVDVRYHYKFLNYTDPLYSQISWWDVSVRSTETVTKEPFWIMDNAIRSCNYDGIVDTDIDYGNALAKRSLVPPSFNIENIETSLEDGKLKVSADFTKIGTYFDDTYGAHKVWVRYMIVQKHFAEGNGTIHRNVMVEMLPSGPGNLAGEISDTIAMGQTQTITQLWDPLINTIGNEYRLVIAAYAWKDGKVHEVEQVAFKDIPQSAIPQVEENRIAKEGILTDKNIDGQGVLLYPNPTDNEITILLPLIEDSKLPIQWTINSMNGKTILTGSEPAGTPSLHIPVHNIADGMYVITINDGVGNQHIKKFTVLH